MRPAQQIELLYRVQSVGLFLLSCVFAAALLAPKEDVIEVVKSITGN